MMPLFNKAHWLLSELPMHACESAHVPALPPQPTEAPRCVSCLPTRPSLHDPGPPPLTACAAGLLCLSGNLFPGYCLAQSCKPFFHEQRQPWFCTCTVSGPEATPLGAKSWGLRKTNLMTAG